MRRHILILSSLISCNILGFAQDFDNNPSIKIDNSQADIHFTVGARFMGDVAYFDSDHTKMNSGAALADSRIRTSMTYKNWYFYADFGFGGGRFSQKNIFLQWSKMQNGGTGQHIIKAGYYSDPGSMARNTSLGSYHFISRAGSADALGDGRHLGITYKYTNSHFFANQGVYSVDTYNQQEAGLNGVSFSGRWLYIPIDDKSQSFHIGVNARFTNFGGNDDEGEVVKNILTLGQTMETYVDDTKDIVSVSIPWVNNDINLGAEFLYRNTAFFIRGEYLYRHITKKRDSYSVFSDAQANHGYSGSYDEWLTSNPLRSNDFHGGYVEMGYRIFGSDYTYSNREGLLGGLGGQSLEVVARYNYTGLNDIVEGDLYSVDSDQYYPANIHAQQYSSTSVGGGDIHSVTIGANYSFNRYVQVMLNYTYSNLDRDKLPHDKNFHAVQGRVMFTF